MAERLVSIDIGTSTIRVLMADVDENGKLNVVARGLCDSQGVRKGSIVDLERCAQALRLAVEEAEQMVSAPVDSAVVGIGGQWVQGKTARGMIAITGRDQRITEQDKARVEEQARAVMLPSDYEILQTLPRSYTVDSMEDVEEPLGMMGSRLEAEVNVISVNQNSLRNVQTVVNTAGIHMDDKVLDVLAAAETVTVENEREMGVMVVDLGAGTTKFAIYEKKSLVQVGYLPCGADYFVKDLSIGCKTSVQSAEKILKRSGCVLASIAGEDETVEIEGTQGRKSQLISRKLVADMLQVRAEEILGLVRDEVKREGNDRRFPAGLVLTGGGAMVDGMVELSEKIFDLPARRGEPLEVGGLQDMVNGPLYATSIGLLNWSRRHAPRRKATPLERGWDRLIGMVFGKGR